MGWLVVLRQEEKQRWCYCLSWQHLACLQCSCDSQFPSLFSWDTLWSWNVSPDRPWFSHLFIQEAVKSIWYRIIHFSSVPLLFLDLHKSSLRKFFSFLRKFISYFAQWPISLFNWNRFHLVSATTPFIGLLSLPEAVQEDLICISLCDWECGYRRVFLNHFCWTSA